MPKYEQKHIKLINIKLKVTKYKISVFLKLNPIFLNLEAKAHVQTTSSLIYHLYWHHYFKIELQSI